MKTRLTTIHPHLHGIADNARQAGARLVGLTITDAQSERKVRVSRLAFLTSHSSPCPMPLKSYSIRGRVHAEVTTSWLTSVVPY